MGHVDRPASPPRHELQTLLGVRVPVRDGLQLSANLWLPLAHPDEPDERFPAILEMIPYGKDSRQRNADVARGEWLARRGYALCRLDVRGTGSSPGNALDEYAADETRDGYDVVEWLAAQSWCNGNVGMWGISYGGFSAIQVAKLRPPHLRAILPLMATDDRYLTDIHYVGGCVTASALSQYAVSQVAMNAMPPDPEQWGEGWREDWHARLEQTPAWLFEWLRRQLDGPYWRQGSLAPDHGAIEAAILQVGGWTDWYVDPILRMHERCTAPRRSIVGNWVHGLPDSTYPGPTIDWLHELVRFLDYRLKGIDNGVMDEPGFTWFERDYTPPEPFPAVMNGRWRAAVTFPHPATTLREWHLAGGDTSLAGRLVPGPAALPGVDRFPHRATWGTRSGLSWGGGHPPNGLARDLRPDEALVPTYTSDPLPEALEILGLPTVVLHVAASAPVATVVVRLADVAPDGTSSLVSAGALNLTHRRSHADPSPLEPGRTEEVHVPVRAAGYRWLAGHRIRLSIGSGSWPALWPSPHPVELAVHHGATTPSRLVLPVVPPAGGPGDVAPPAFQPAPPADPAIRERDEDPPTWRIVEDVVDGSTTVHVHEGRTDVLPDGRRLYTAETIAMTARDADPARTDLAADVVYRWHERTFETEIRARARQSSTAAAFGLSVDLEVDVDGESFFAGRWSETIPRRLV